MTEPNSRLVAVVLEVGDLDRSTRLYRDGFGVDVRPSDHGGDDRWISGRHSANSWTDGPFLHFALYEAKTDERSVSAQVAFAVTDLEVAHAAALAAGAELIHAPRIEPWGLSSRYRDFDGNVVELTQRG